MKFQVIQRSTDDTLPAQLGAAAPQKRNLDPALHPFARAREYQRALTASKLERMFAKPFVDSLEGHNDGIYCSSRDPDRLGTVATGAGDGDIRLWSLSTRQTLVAIPKAHRSMVKDLTFLPTTMSRSRRSQKASTSKLKLEDTLDTHMPADDDKDEDNNGITRDDAGGVESGMHSRFLSCSADKTIKLWDSAVFHRSAQDAGNVSIASQPVQTYMGRLGFNSVSHHRSDRVFASASDRIDIWDETRTEPTTSMSFDSMSNIRGKGKDDSIAAGDHIVSVRFNQSETSVLASAGSDKTVCLYDVRSGKATSRLSLNMRANQLSWNPMQPPILLIASEDSQLYTYDIRKMTSATQVFKGHVGAVMSCDWSPTGRDFVSGSYDRTVRLWKAGQGKSEDTYHTQRMQRVFSTLFTLDSRFVLSGSDDGNLRIWKARASARLGALSSNEMTKMEYRDSLREKWRNVGDVAKVERQRFVPKPIHNATKLRREMVSASNRKDDNRRRHAPKSRAGEKPKSERKRGIARVE